VIFHCISWSKPGLQSWLALRRICGHQSDNEAGFSANIWVSPVTSYFTSTLYSGPRD
jgi:hypothetical protein